MAKGELLCRIEDHANSRALDPYICALSVTI